MITVAWLADVEPLVVAVRVITVDQVMLAFVHIEWRNGKFLPFLTAVAFQMRENARRDDMQAAEGQFFQVAAL